MFREWWQHISTIISKNRDEKLPKTVPKGIIILYTFPQRSHNLVPKVLDNRIAQKRDLIP
jgi:hypothetical protein